MTEEKTFEQLQQMQEDLIEQANLEREAARERANDRRQQLNEQTHQLQQKLEENSRSRNDQLQMQQQELETERAKLKEEREKANADTQRQTQEHRERITMKTQEHKEHVERRYEADEKAAQEAKQGREERRNDAKEHIDRASADHLRNVDTQKDSLDHMRKQQEGQIQRRIENINQQKIQQTEEQKKIEQATEAQTVGNRDDKINNLLLQVNNSMALIDTARISKNIDSHIRAYGDTLRRCTARGQDCVKESNKVKEELSELVSSLEAFSEARNNPTAADSEYWTSDQAQKRIEGTRNLVKNYCEKALSLLDELQSICSNSTCSLSTNASLSAELRQTYKNHLCQIDDAARELHSVVYKTKSSVGNRYPLSQLKELDKKLEDGIKKLKNELHNIPQAQDIDGIQKQIKVMQQNVKDSGDRLAEVNKQKSEKLDTSPQVNAIQDGNE